MYVEFKLLAELLKDISDRLDGRYRHDEVVYIYDDDDIGCVVDEHVLGSKPNLVTTL